MIRSRLAALRASTLALVPAMTFATPTLVSCTPGTLAMAGGACTIAGTGLASCYAVWFDGVPASSVQPLNDGQVGCVAPPHAAGSVTIHVATSGGGMRLANGVTYAAPVPIVTSITPNTGSALGGTPVTLAGTGFTTATSAAAGAVNLSSFVVVSDISITGVTGAHAAGANNVTATNPFGTGTLAGGFTYISAPTLASVSTSGGAVGDVGGGYPATLTGTNYVTGATATFGGTAATSVVVVNATTITCVVPAHITGAVSVVVTTPGGANGSNTAFRYAGLADYAFSSLYVAPYAGVPFGATASAGVSATTGALVSSGVGGADPTTGTAQNGKASAAFAAASSQYLTNPTPSSSLFTAGAGSIVTLFKPVSAVAPNGTVYGDPALYHDAGFAHLGLTYTTSGFTGYIADGATFKSVAAATGAYHLAMSRWNGSLLGVKVDSAAEQTTAAGSATTGAGTMSVGRGYSGGTIDGSVLFFGTAAVDMSGSYADIKAILNTMFNLTL